MVFVDAESVEAGLVGEFQLVEIIVEKVMADLGIVKVAQNIHPYAARLLF